MCNDATRFVIWILAVEAEANHAVYWEKRNLAVYQWECWPVLKRQDQQNKDRTNDSSLFQEKNKWFDLLVCFGAPVYRKLAGRLFRWSVDTGLACASSYYQANCAKRTDWNRRGGGVIRLMGWCFPGACPSHLCSRKPGYSGAPSTRTLVRHGRSPRLRDLAVVRQRAGPDRRATEGEPGWNRGVGPPPMPALGDGGGGARSESGCWRVRLRASRTRRHCRRRWRVKFPQATGQWVDASGTWWRAVSANRTCGRVLRGP